jgi:hypothetical protein
MRPASFYGSNFIAEKVHIIDFYCKVTFKAGDIANGTNHQAARQKCESFQNEP